jgi:hypothetical protein
MNRFNEWKEYCDQYAKTQGKKDNHVDNQDKKLEHGKPPSIFIVEACKTVRSIVHSVNFCLERL